MTRKTWRIEVEALREVENATARYESERAGLGDDFSAAVDATFIEREGTPQIGSVERYRSLEIRRAKVEGFPYLVVYAELEEEIVVVAVMYAGRHPNYWRKRLRALR
jgi:plasmid stabilization system protein ParE